MATLIVNDIRFENVSDPDWNTQTTRTTTNLRGFPTVMPVECYIAATVRVPANVLMADLTGRSNDVRLELDDGRVIVGREMWHSGDGAVRDDTTRLQYVGMEVAEE